MDVEEMQSRGSVESVRIGLLRPATLSPSMPSQCLYIEELRGRERQFHGSKQVPHNLNAPPSDRSRSLPPDPPPSDAIGAPCSMLGSSLRPRTRAASHERSMPTHSRVYSKDEELGKRDDDFRPRRSPTTASLAQPWRWRKRRLLAVAAVIGLLFFVLRNILPEGLGAITQGAGTSAGPLAGVGRSGRANVEPTGPPPRPKSQTGGGDSKHYYDGPIKFYRLATSLHGIAKTMGTKPQNRNVLFTVSSLKSASNLMPMACEMAKWDRNYVHLALLGRDSLPLRDVLEINGVDTDDCAVYFHDARGDYSEYSTDKRAEVAVAGAMKHINDFMHPQVIIMDDSSHEDQFFTRAMRSKSKEMGKALIEVPAGRYEEFFWMTRLDSGSLSNWFRPNIEILVHAPPDSSGGLLRLIKSLGDADYAGLPVPRLTIELPSTIDSFARNSLQWLGWPPGSPKQDLLTLRHRIPSTHLSSEQASVRFVESFYPSNTDDNHVLVLSAQAEVSPLYLQYLYYVILEYKHSSYGPPESENMLGISLDVPSTLLNGSNNFAPPLVANMNAEKFKDEKEYDQAGPAPFLYQAPSATASLIFGDKWTALHSFLSNRLASSHAGKAERTKKVVPETEPAWVEYLLELMRARGWSMLHPAASLVTIHNELAQIPEEYLREPRAGQKGAEVLKQSDYPEEESFLTAAEAPVYTERIEHEPQTTQALHDLLPFAGDLPELPHLPYLNHEGVQVNSSAIAMAKEEFVSIFRQRIGGCEGEDATRKRVVSDSKATNDLFCLPGVDVEFDEGPEEDASDVAHAVIAETETEREAPTALAEAEGSGKDGEEAGEDDADVDEQAE